MKKKLVCAVIHFHVLKTGSDADHALITCHVNTKKGNLLVAYM